MTGRSHSTAGIDLIRAMLEKSGAPDPDTVRHLDNCLSCLSCMTTCAVKTMSIRSTARGRIKMTSADPNAPLLIDPDYLSAGPDLSALCAAVEHSRAIGSAAGLSEWRKREIARIPRGKIELAEFVAQNVGSYWHPVGTCAMGIHHEAVVDPSLCVYGTTNLRVADASIMPTIISGNTNAPTIVIAERAAQMIIPRQTQR